MTRSDVLIIGAGPTGLVLCALARQARYQSAHQRQDRGAGDDIAGFGGSGANLGTLSPARPRRRGHQARPQDARDQSLGQRSRLTSEANLLVMPNIDAANITFNASKIVAG